MATYWPASKERTREAVVELFVMLDAVVKVVDQLTDAHMELDEAQRGPSPWGTIVDWDAVGSRLGGVEYDELWPEDGPHGPEWDAVQREAALLAARLLAALAANPAHCARRAAHLFEVAESEGEPLETMLVGRGTLS